MILPQRLSDICQKSFCLFVKHLPKPVVGELRFLDAVDQHDAGPPVDGGQVADGWPGIAGAHGQHRGRRGNHRPGFEVGLKRTGPLLSSWGILIGIKATTRSTGVANQNG